jgi:hypothetical protein
MMATSVQKAKDTLLRALDQLEKAEQDLGAEPERVDLVVVYSIGYDDTDDGAWHEIGGWTATAGPKWVHAKLMERAAMSFNDASMAVDDISEEGDSYNGEEEEQ